MWPSSVVTRTANHVPGGLDLYQEQVHTVGNLCHFDTYLAMSFPMVGCCGLNTCVDTARFVCLLLALILCVTVMLLKSLCQCYKCVDRCNGLRVYAVCVCNKVRLPGTGQSAHVIGGSRFTRPASNSRRTLLN